MDKFAYIQGIISFAPGSTDFYQDGIRSGDVRFSENEHPRIIKAIDRVLKNSKSELNFKFYISTDSIQHKRYIVTANIYPVFSCKKVVACEITYIREFFLPVSCTEKKIIDLYKREFDSVLIGKYGYGVIKILQAKSNSIVRKYSLSKPIAKEIIKNQNELTRVTNAMSKPGHTIGIKFTAKIMNYQQSLICGFYSTGRYVIIGNTPTTPIRRSVPIEVVTP